jgi:hypothetical protein
MYTSMYLKHLYLPLSALTYLQNNSIWNISKIAWGHNNQNHQIVQDIISNQDTLKIYYPKGSYSPSKSNPQGGIGFYASPHDIFPAEDILFTYQVKFDSTFNPVLGGKLPGLFLSKGTDKKYMNDASGGKHSSHASSIRISWRKNLSAEAYLYIPSNQSSDYLSIPKLIQNDIYGDSLWRNSFKFNPSIWNNISIRVKLNSFDKSNLPKPNGILTVSINNIQKNFNKLIWRTDQSVFLTSILFSTFFGGSTPTYSTPVDTWTYFTNITISKLK